jgi:serine/threonine-protein kinase RsbW
MLPPPHNSFNDDALPYLLDLRMPGDPAAIAGVTDLVTGALSKLDLPEDKRLEISLAVQEALANAVIHGCKSDSSKEVRCRLWRDPQGRVLIVITDPGPGFDLGQLFDPKQPEHIYADHGRGVYLIHQLMDEVHFEKGGSEIRMWKF